MDATVLQALGKWPSVPACYGWLALDSRGQWYLRDALTQSQGAFPASKGVRLEHEGLIQFINRNYCADEKGCWYFQNGPQRVYVELEATPFIWRVTNAFEAVSQTGHHVQPLQCLLDKEGKVYLETDLGFGLVHTMDVGLVAAALENQRWKLQEMDISLFESQFGFVRNPQRLREQSNKH